MIGIGIGPAATRRAPASGPDPEAASAVVAGAGTASSNGTYVRTGMTNGKGDYQLGDNRVFWNGAWNIVDNVSLEAIAYSSGEDVAFPWLVVTWTAVAGSLPVPAVTMG